MNTNLPTIQPSDLDDPVLREADTAAALEHLVSGGLLDPTVTGRVHARAERVTKDIRRTHGLVDNDTFQSLLDDEA